MVPSGGGSGVNAIPVARRFRDRFAAGHGGFPLVGTPDHIADQLALLSEAGVAGTTLSFVDYAKEFPYFRQEVLPRLVAKGLRTEAT